MRSGWPPSPPPPTGCGRHSPNARRASRPHGRCGVRSVPRRRRGRRQREETRPCGCGSGSRCAVETECVEVSRGQRMPGHGIGSRLRRAEQEQRLEESVDGRMSTREPIYAEMCYAGMCYSDGPADSVLTGPISCPRPIRPAGARGFSRSVCERGVMGLRTGIGSS